MDIVAQLNSVLAGRYAVEREIGAGGMATVYLARDLKHDRHVALKVLSPELGAVLGAERFLAEIRVTANLQHPNLLPLFDSGEANGLLYYVMPFVEGENLRARLEREKQLPVDEAVRIASAVASALEYAHARHVIHRDLKPENILLQGGQPVIADFGIALAVSNAGGARVTQTGLSLGTPQYMSPEQATGDRQIDARADIYSLGAVTYEMLVGDPPHLGSTAQAIIAKVLTERPPSVRVARPSVPDHVAFAVEKALEKLPADRWRTAAEFDATITGRSGAGDTAAIRRTQSGAPTTQRSRAWVVAMGATLAGATALAAVCAVGWWTATHRRTPSHVVRFTLENPPDAQMDPEDDTFAVSPDGQSIVFVAVRSDQKHQLFVRTLDDVAPRPVPGTEGASRPFFSFDNHFIGFNAGGNLNSIPVAGGTPHVLMEGIARYGASWGPNGVIAVSFNGRIALVPENGGPRRFVGDTLGIDGERWPVFLANGRTVLFADWGGRSADDRIVARSLAGGKPVDLGVRGTPMRVIDGFLFYTSGSVMYGIRFDQQALRTSGEPLRVVDGLPLGGDRDAATLSASGALAYQTGASLQELIVADLHGNVRLLTKDQRRFGNPRYAPDGTRAAVSVAAPSSEDIWIYHVATGAATRLTAGGSANSRPEWSLDGTRVIYRSNRDSSSSLWWQTVDGSAPAQLLLKDRGKDVWEGVLSPDGATMLYRTGTQASANVWFRRLSGDTTTKSLGTPGGTDEPRFSPDGKWVAYSSTELGTRQVFVKPFPSLASRYQVSQDGGSAPVWSRDGKRLFYAGYKSELIGARVQLAAAFAIVGRDTVVNARVLSATGGHPDYDVAPDGEHILLVRRVTSEVPTIVVTGWLDAWLAQQTGAKRP